jgi:penicillin-binding protein 1A
MPDGTARQSPRRQGGVPTLRAPRRATGATAKPRRGKARPGKKKGAKRGRTRRPLWARLAIIATIAFIWVLLGVGALVLWYARDLPDIDQFARQTRQPGITVLAADGTPVASYGELYGRSLQLDEMSPWLPKAVMAIEDRRFYEHFGIDLWGTARALFVNLTEGELRQGGSTITQQLAKNLFLTPERSLKRKVQEAILALQLESRYSKDQILTLYLNRVYLGAGAHGVDAAAERFFGKGAEEVTLYEAALIAGLLKAPSRYNPANDALGADARAKLVLAAMVEAGHVSAAEAAAAFAAKTDAAPPAFEKGRHFADWTLSQVEGYLGQFARDIVVETTLDLALQTLAEEALAAVLAEEGPAAGASEGAVVVMTPKGEILAMVGGRDYRASPFNRATQALRQPGSAFKLFVFLAGLEAGLTPDSRFVDQPVTIEGWSPDNYGDRYYGEVTLREAFARSANSVSAQVLARAGKDKVVEVARRLGITTKLPSVPSLALGSAETTLLEMTAAFAVFANQGYGVWPTGIALIRGTEGTTLFRRQEDGLSRLVAPALVDRMTDLMTAVVGWGTGKRADPGRPAAGKTGTSQDYRDAWFFGFTAELVVGVWIGNDDGKPMDKVTGGSLPAEVFRRIVTAALEGLPAQPLPGGGDPAAGDPPLSGPAEPRQAEDDDDVIGRILEELENPGPAPDIPPPRAEDPSKDK